MRTAAIDIGSNSVRLLVAERAPGGGLFVCRRGLEITRLGEGIAKGGAIAERAAERTLEAVGRLAAAAREAGAASVLAFGTAALREAANALVFIRRMRETAGIDVRVLTGGEEALLAWRGMTRVLSPPLDGVVAVDIGGGSVELAADPAGGFPVSASLPLGCVRMTERFLSSDPPAGAGMEALRRHASETLAAGMPTSIPRPATRLVGAGGTITSAATLSLGLDTYAPERIHGFALTSREVGRLAALLASLPLAPRREIRGIEAKRADILPAGLLVLGAVMEFFSVPSLTVSDEGILHAALLELSGSDQDITLRGNELRTNIP